jgi:hypothetical protein
MHQIVFGIKVLLNLIKFNKIFISFRELFNIFAKHHTVYEQFIYSASFSKRWNTNKLNWWAAKNYYECLTEILKIWKAHRCESLHVEGNLKHSSSLDIDFFVTSEKKSSSFEIKSKSNQKNLIMKNNRIRFVLLSKSTKFVE